MSEHKDPNEGEGNRTAARHYDEEVRGFVAKGNVGEAATEAREAIERDPIAAAKAEASARRGPRISPVHVGGGTSLPHSNTMIDRMRHALEHLRARFGHK